MIIKSEQEMLDFGKNFAKKISEKPTVIELIGDVGAGKTTFTRGLAEGLGIKSQITSPSFTISKSYALKNGGRLIHYDFYRLSNPGLMTNNLNEDLKNPKNIIVIEWANSIKNILPQDYISITLSKNDNEIRDIKIEHNKNNIFQHISKSTEKDIIKTSTTNIAKSNQKNNLKLYLDTSTPKTILKINDQEYSCDFDNDLAEKLLEFIHDKLSKHKKTFHDITEITFMSGPGSFTGLRIGATIVNTLVNELNIPLYDHFGKKHKIITPKYDRPANISKPRK